MPIRTFILAAAAALAMTVPAIASAHEGHPYERAAYGDGHRYGDAQGYVRHDAYASRGWRGQRFGERGRLADENRARWGAAARYRMNEGWRAGDERRGESGGRGEGW